MRGRATVSFLLLDKKLGDEEVVGLAEFWVLPQHKGLGRASLMMIEALSTPKAVVGFAERDVVEFYAQCDWYIGKVYKDHAGIDKWLVASSPVNETDFKGDLW